MVEAVATNLLDDPSVQGIVISARDLTDRRRAEGELREAQERFRSAFENAPIGMALMALDGRLFRVNRALAQILGRSGRDLLGASVVDLTHPDDLPDLRASMRCLLSGEAPSMQLEQRYLHHDGHPVWIAVSVSLVRDLQSTPLYFVCQMEDITERRASGAALAHQAIHDPLTGLPNRTLFVERLERELARAAVNHERVAVLFLDLDRFKVVNDSLGHSAGDRLLVAVADRLSGAMRPSDIVARFGGDEFTVLCPNVPTEETAEMIAERLIQATSRPVALVEGEVFVTASVGITLSGGESDTPETLLRNADAAMYRAKEQGRDRSEVFDARAHHHAVDSLRTGNALHRAIERGELRLHYQPVISLDAGALSGFEALIRWDHPERGLVSPMEFIPLAEETGLIVPLGSWALTEACRQLKAWHGANADGRRLTMSVNLSPRQLAEPSLPNEVARILHESDVPPECIWLEITESTLMRDAESAMSALGALARARVAPRGRRLRLRVLVARVPRAPAGRGAQGRPLVRAGRRPTRRQHRDRDRDREPVARARAALRRRGDRDHAAARRAAGGRVRDGPGLPVRRRAARRRRTATTRRSPCPRGACSAPPRTATFALLDRFQQFGYISSHSVMARRSRGRNRSDHDFPQISARDRETRAAAPTTGRSHACHAHHQALGRPGHRHPRPRPPLPLRGDVLAPDPRAHCAPPAPPSRRPLRPQPRRRRAPAGRHVVGPRSRPTRGHELADRAHAAAARAVRPRLRRPPLRHGRGAAQRAADQPAPPAPAPARRAARARGVGRGAARGSADRGGAPPSRVASRSRCSSRATTPTTSSACCTRWASTPRCATRARGGPTTATAKRSRS